MEVVVTACEARDCQPVSQLKEQADLEAVKWNRVRLEGDMRWVRKGQPLVVALKEINLRQASLPISDKPFSAQKIIQPHIPTSCYHGKQIIAQDKLERSIPRGLHPGFDPVQIQSRRRQDAFKCGVSFA
jgi:hypothetical protein